MASKKDGTTTTIDVSSLPKRRPRNYTPEQRVAILNKVKAAIANGAQVQAALKKAGIGDAQYYAWRARTKKLNGSVRLKANPGVRITLTIDGLPVQVSLEDARSIQAGLNELLR